MKYLPFVNIKMGTRSVKRFSKGNTLPLTQLPFAMAAFAPQTEGNDSWFYHPDHPYLEGVRLTHQPSPWIADYGTFLMTPQNDVIADDPKDAWSGCRTQNSILRPDYLKVTFLRSDSDFEVTPVERGGLLRLTFHDDRPSFLSFFPTLGKYTYRFDEESDTLFGTTDGHSQDIAVDFRMHFVLRFPRGSVDHARTRAANEGKDGIFHLALAEKRVEFRLAISYIDEETGLR